MFLSLLIQDLGKDEVFYHVETDGDATVEDLKCLITVQSNIQVEQQVLYFRQDILRTDDRTLKSFGIQNNDMINLGISNLSSADQDLMQNFFGNLKTAKKVGPRLN
jgi:hypothetical protein